MAQMYPNDIELVNCTDSEKVFYYSLKKNLPARVHVFYSVKWYTQNNGVRENSESDFLIFDPDFGFLTIEVKGGIGIEKLENQWILHLDESTYRTLNKSPFQQAEDSMRFFKQYFEDQYKQTFNGVYGFACAFPRYNVPEGFGADSPKELIIDFSDLQNLNHRINQIFHYWSSTRRNHVFLVEETKRKFINLINKRISLSAISGETIERQEEKLRVLNRIQENYLDFVENYRNAFIAGGAGTGKTWIALKKAIRNSLQNDDVLLLCYNSDLAQFLNEQVVKYNNITAKTFWQFIKDILSDEEFDKLSNDKELQGVFDVLSNNNNLPKYHSIMVDEAQDFNEEWAMCVRLFLRDEKNSNLYVFFDSEQNIFHRNFRNGFMIDNPTFILKENLRNTSEIIKWVKETTDLGHYTKVNNIPGTRPEVSTHKRKKDARNRLESLLKQLIQKELIKTSSITVLSNRTLQNSILNGSKELGPFRLVESKKEVTTDTVLYRTVQGFKGLESDVVIYIKHCKTGFDSNMKLDFVAYTRAKFMLYVIEYTEDQ